MTKKLSILCAAVVLLAACSQKEELRLLPNDNAIEFSAYSASSVVTRGSVVQPTAIQGADKGIGIFAFYQEERTGDFNTYVHKEPGFMYNQRVTTSDNGATWSYTPTKYWPNNDGDKISFFAYAPYDADKTWESFGFKTDINGQTMTVRFPILQEAADQIDHIFATPQLNLTKQAVDVNGTNYATGTNNVMFDFKHITSQVNIYVGVEQSSASQQATPWTDTHTEIVVNSIQLKSRSTAMTLNYDISSGKAVAQPTTFASDKQAITLNIDNFIPTAATINTTNYCADSLLAADANNFKQLNKANSVLFLAPEALGEVVVTYTTTTTDGVHGLNSTVVPNTVTQSLSNITLEPGRSYRLNLLIGMNTVTVNAIPCAWTTPGFEDQTEVILPNCLCFTAKTAGATVKMVRRDIYTPIVHLVYCTNTDYTWKDLVVSTDEAACTTVTLEDIGDKLYIKAKDGEPNIRLAERKNVPDVGTTTRFNRFQTTGDLKVSGNIMYLLDGTNPPVAMTSDNTWCFSYLFTNTTISDASELLLPATTLANACYADMFDCCFALTTAPALPATKLPIHCYGYMFSQCIALAVAPALPATTLAEECYCFMFQGCTALTTAPVLPATELATNCYASMFSGCSNLSSVTMLATDVGEAEEPMSGFFFSNLSDWLAGAGTDPSVISPTVYVNQDIDDANKTIVTKASLGWTVTKLTE